VDAVQTCAFLVDGLDDSDVFRYAVKNPLARSVAHSTAAPDMTLVGSAPDLAAGFKELEKRPDVLLVDLQLPDGNGIDLIREVSRRLVARLGTAPMTQQSAPNAEVLAPLSDREIEVLTLATKGFSYDEIAGLMNVSRHTVQTYVKRSYREPHVNSKVEALSEARAAAARQFTDRDGLLRRMSPY
jgi:DNA-binding NarL/FixJ family response regulator